MRYLVVVAYDGTNYKGWQKQRNSQTIQECLENALQKICSQKIDIVGSGRTDALVHAYGQTFHFDCDKSINCEQYRMGLNSLLPFDIRIQSIQKVNAQFHARFDCIKKRYDYYLTNEVENPFFEHYMGKERKSLDIDAMKKCLHVFIGTHDFTTFSSNRINPNKSRVKTISRLELCVNKDYLHFIFEGDGFLRYMVRMLVGSIIEVGKGHVSESDLIKMLNAKDKELCRYKADGQGLYLVKVEYKEDSLCEK